MIPPPFKNLPLPRIDHAYIVGGSVRDLLLGQTPADYDIGVSGHPEKVAVRVARVLNGRVVYLGKPGLAVFRIVAKNRVIDISELKGACIEEDLQQRDFTINAMAYDMSTGKIVDCHGGKQDLNNKIVRMVSGQVFRDDPIRLLRAYRLSTVLKFSIDPDTERTIRKDAKLIEHSAGERIRDEFFRLLQVSDAHGNLCRMAKYGLLFGIFPELKALQGRIQNNHHRYDVLDHTLCAFFHLEKIFNAPEPTLAKTVGVIQRSMGGKEGMLLKCAILLHDIGKPRVKFQDAKGDLHFFRHEQLGASMVKTISNRLKFSNKETDFIEFIVKNHLRPLHLFQANKTDKLTVKGITRFFIKCGEKTPALMLHAIADQRGKGETSATPFLEFILDMLHRYYSEYKPRLSNPPLITGHDLMENFGLKPSPQFGKILSMVEESRLSKQIRNKAEALTLVEEYLASVDG
jgi:tRNA nucleotidyltransferase/poly(A) polymerase